ncbi:hypothetical protein KRMM14A1259_43730 [Krasilnikovia sp. MM14-A1259]
MVRLITARPVVTSAGMTASWLRREPGPPSEGARVPLLIAMSLRQAHPVCRDGGHGGAGRTWSPATNVTLIPDLPGAIEARPCRAQKRDHAGS